MAWKLDELPSTGIASSQNIAPANNEPNILQRATSIPAKLISHAVEVGGGLPGNVVNAMGRSVNYANEAANRILGAQPQQEQPEALPGLSKYAAEILPTSESINKRNTQFLEHYLGEGANTPQNFVEKFGQSLAITLPLAYATGGTSALLPEAARTAAGSLASQGAEALGGEPWLQTTADLLGRAGFDLARVVANSANVKDQARNLVNKNYELANDLAQGKIVPAPETASAANSIFEKLKQNKAGILNTGKINKRGLFTHPLTKQFEEITSEMQRGHIDLKTALDTRKHLNGLINDLPYGSSERKLYEVVRNGINKEVIEPAKTTLPDFGKALNTADELWKAENVHSVVREYLDKHSSFKDQLKSKIGLGLIGGSFYKGGPMAALGTSVAHIAGGKAGKYLVDALEPFLKSPAMRNIYRDLDIAIETGLTRSIPELIKKWDNESVKLENQIAKKNKENRFVLD